MKKLLYLFFLLISNLSAAQANLVILSPDNRRGITITDQLEVFLDSTGRMRFEELSADSSLVFVPQSKIGKPGNNVYWVRVMLKSDLKEDLLLWAGAAWWDYATFYITYPDSSLVTLTTGLLCKQSERGGKDYATFTLPAGKQLIIYARLSTSGYFMRMEKVNLILGNHSRGLENERYYLYLSAIIVGILLGFAFYNVSFSLSSKDTSYFWYFLYLSGLAVSFSGQLGSGPSYLTQFFLPEHPLLGLFMKRLADPVAFVSLILFSIQFLRTRSKHPLFHRALWLIIAALVLYNTIWLFGYVRSNSIGILLFLIAVGTVIAASVHAYTQGFKVARFFIVGQCLVFSGVLLSILQIVFDVSPFEYLPNTRFLIFVQGAAPFFFGALEALIFSIALTDRDKERLEGLVNTRTNELNQSLQALKATQSQLVQSEKMASLGELTAGIAHEIQNPLNFVKNFSEVNSELLAELEREANKGNLEAVKGLARDIRDNEEKIVSHGKRADGIVKGMLQHSRASSGKKEPTDINALCDEYLRLAYHGLRAKDKSFNANFETHLDPAVGKVNVLPQEIGRVVLNLINNAFYAVTEKRKNTMVPYEPTVTVSTRKAGSHIEIRVSDNGTGIPEAIIKKIFQPFFTTKPTGQGTGLGLSLSYDIVTKGHGGELLLESTEGTGTEFVVRLPVG